MWFCLLINQVTQIHFGVNSVAREKHNSEDVNSSDADPVITVITTV